MIFQAKTQAENCSIELGPRVIASLDPALCAELGMPGNVMCAKRIPQSELLAHPSTKVCNLLNSQLNLLIEDIEVIEKIIKPEYSSQEALFLTHLLLEVL